MEQGICNLARSEMGGEIMTAEGGCDQWETYDAEHAMEVRQAEEEEAAGDATRMKEICQIAFEKPLLSCRFCGCSNPHSLETCQECGKRRWNDPDDTQLGHDLGKLARENPDVARAQTRYEDGMDKLREKAQRLFRDNRKKPR